MIDIPRKAGDGVHTVIVDPAGSEYILGNQPITSAGGASISIYKFLAEKNTSFSFAETVRNDFEKQKDDPTSHASVGYYKSQNVHVIHVVGPDARTKPFINKDTFMKALKQAYKNVFAKFIETKQKLEQTQQNKQWELRLLPISGGIFAGNQGGDMHNLTATALYEALVNLREPETVWENVNINMCIYKEAEFANYKKTFSDKKER